MHYGFFQVCFPCERTLRTCTPERKKKKKEVGAEGGSKYPDGVAYEEGARGKAAAIEAGGNRKIRQGGGAPPKSLSPVTMTQVVRDQVPCPGGVWCAEQILATENPSDLTCPYLHSPGRSQVIGQMACSGFKRFDHIGSHQLSALQPRFAMSRAPQGRPPQRDGPVLGPRRQSCPSNNLSKRSSSK